MGWKDGYQDWLRYYAFRESDDLIEPFLKMSPTGDWIVKARTALFLSQREMARRMGISPKAYRLLEANEEKASLERLRKCAAAMDCEIVYAIRPRSRKKFSEEIWDLLRPHLESRKGNRNRAAHAKQLMFQPEFRRQHGRSKNWQPEAEEDKWFWKRARPS